MDDDALPDLIYRLGSIRSDGRRIVSTWTVPDTPDNRVPTLDALEQAVKAAGGGSGLYSLEVLYLRSKIEGYWYLDELITQL